MHLSRLPAALSSGRHRPRISSLRPLVQLGPQLPPVPFMLRLSQENSEQPSLQERCKPDCRQVARDP